MSVAGIEKMRHLTYSVQTFSVNSAISRDVISAGIDRNWNRSNVTYSPFFEITSNDSGGQREVMAKVRRSRPIRKPYRPDSWTPPKERFWIPSVPLVVGLIGTVYMLWRILGK